VTNLESEKAALEEAKLSLSADLVTSQAEGTEMQTASERLLKDFEELQTINSRVQERLA
jgi:hypothetical protein